MVSQIEHVVGLLRDHASVLNAACRIVRPQCPRVIKSMYAPVKEAHNRLSSPTKTYRKNASVQYKLVSLPVYYTTNMDVLECMGKLVAFVKHEQSKQGRRHSLVCGRRPVQVPTAFMTSLASIITVSSSLSNSKNHKEILLAYADHPSLQAKMHMTLVRMSAIRTLTF